MLGENAVTGLTRTCQAGRSARRASGPFSARRSYSMDAADRSASEPGGAEAGPRAHAFGRRPDFLLTKDPRSALATLTMAEVAFR
jgi:hypothetical protein